MKIYAKSFLTDSPSTPSTLRTYSSENLNHLIKIRKLLFTFGVICEFAKISQVYVFMQILLTNQSNLFNIGSPTVD